MTEERFAAPPALILAAGSASRFGSDKRLFAIDGIPMLSRTLDAYLKVFERVAAVIRPGETAVAALVQRAGCDVVEAADAAEGQSRSLAAGIAAFSDAPALVIGLGDMPFVLPSTLRTLVHEMAASPVYIVRPRHDGRPGNPVGFPAHTFAALARIEGDRGARQVIAASDRVRLVDVDDHGVLADVDRPPAPSASAGRSTSA